MEKINVKSFDRDMKLKKGYFGLGFYLGEGGGDEEYAFDFAESLC